MEWITTFQPWHWLVLGIVLLGLETLGIGGFLIGLAIACLFQSIMVFVWPGLEWSFQLLVFGVNAVVFTFLYWRVFRPFNDKTDQPAINDRAAQMIGRRIEISEAFAHGEGKVIIGDTYWRIRAEHKLDPGDKVQVKDSEGMLLLVEKI